MTDTDRAFRVLDLTTTLGGAYAAHLLSSGGVEVTRIDPPGGHELRSSSASGADIPAGSSGPLFQWLAGGQQAVTVDPASYGVVVGRALLLLTVILVSLFPALMYFQFDREKLPTQIDRWLHAIFRLDPSLETVADVDAKYGRRVEEFLAETPAGNAAKN